MENWKITYSDYKPEEQPLREALCTLGNGYFATRGAAEEAKADKNDYPGTYLAGGYNRLQTDIAGKVIENEDLVNWPDWTLLKFKPQKGKWFDLDKVKILEYEQELDLKEAVLIRRILFRDEEQRETELVSRRIVSMSNKHLAAINWKLTPKNWSGKITLHSALDGSVINNGVARYRDLNKKHLKILEKGEVEEDSVFLKVCTNQSEIVMAQAARTGVCFDLYESSVERTTVAQDEYIAQELMFDAEENKSITIEKVVAIFTSRDQAISEPFNAAKNAAKRAGNFSELQKQNASAWKELWEQNDIVLEADEMQDQVLLRLHIFHLLQTYSFNSIDADVGVPARGWHGEAYRGHIFWDELFIFPFYNITTPELSRSLLMYRYRRLPEAQHAAQQAGFKGAMFPWQSGSNGREESQVIHLNPESGRWLPDNTHLQRHVNAAIAWNTWKYFETHGDLEFLSFYGAEILIQIANFWASKVTYNEERKKYEIHEIAGPDEYHTKYPDSKEPGLKNNAYTNIMAVWCLIQALQAIEKLDETRVEELMHKLVIDKEETGRWEKISRNMFIPFVEGGKIIEQFEGFNQLRNLDWEKYHKKYGEHLRLDRILENEGDEVTRYKAVKQADVLMLFFLFSSEELTALFSRLGYDFCPAEQIPMNISYYQEITAHGSTLSQLIHSWVYARSRRKQSWHTFKKALVSDFKDVQGGTTPEGIHLGAMAGTVDLILHCYTGMEFKEQTMHFNPQLPDNIKRIKFRIRYMGHWLSISLTNEKLLIRSESGWGNTILIIVKGHEFTFKKGQEKSIDYQTLKSQQVEDTSV